MYTNFEILAEQFYEWLKVHHYSKRSEKTYRQDTTRFTLYLKSQDIETPDKITPQIVYGYQTHLYYAKKKDGQPLAVMTQQKALAVMKTFFAFLIQTDKLSYDPSGGIRMPKKPQTLPEVMTVEEIERIFDAPDLKDIIGFRDRTILETLYSTGMRSSELLELEMTDVDLKNEEIRVRSGKGEKERIVPVGEYALDFIREYVQMIRPKLAGRKRTSPEANLFLSKSGRALTPVALNEIVRRYAKKTGIDTSTELGTRKKITPHTFRHTCATHMLQGGCDIRYIQQLLGHTLLTTTQLYTRVSIDDLKEVHKKHHPREQ